MLKRKDMDEVLDDFSEFSLSSPARKIRRLDAELPPIMEEDEPHNTIPITLQNPCDSTISGDLQLMDEMERIKPSNQERALVLYKPIEPQLFVGPGLSNSSFSVSSDFMPGLKDQYFNQRKPIINENNENLALVPWVPNKSNPFEDSMEIEEERENEEREKVYINNSRDENFHQHCFIPPPFPINQPVSPVMWTW